MKHQVAAALLCFSGGVAQANCLGSGAVVPNEMSRFNANPVAYFIGMSPSQQQAAVRQLAASDSASAARIMTAFRGSPLAQQSAIAAGLGEAARACETVDEVQARAIQAAALGIDPSLRLVFDRAARQAQLGATGGGGGGGGGGGSSGGGLAATSTGSAQNNGYGGATSFSRSNGPTSFDVGSSSGRNVTRGSVTTTTALAGTGTTAATGTDPPAAASTVVSSTVAPLTAASAVSPSAVPTATSP